MMDIRVKVSKPGHIYAAGEMLGLGIAIEILDAFPTEKRPPGFVLAKALVETEFHKNRSAMIQKNLALIAKDGHDIAQFKSISFDPNAGELICAFYEEGDEE